MLNSNVVMHSRDLVVHILGQCGRPVDLMACGSALGLDTAIRGSSVGGGTSGQSVLRIALSVSFFIKRAYLSRISVDDESARLKGGLLQVDREHGYRAVKYKNKEVLERMGALVGICSQDVLNEFQKLRTKAEILAVFDGRTPPIIGHTKLVEKWRGGLLDDTVYKTVVETVQEKFRESHIPFLVAPYEAYGELAFLQQGQMVDLIVTDDCNILACKSGAIAPVLYMLEDMEGGPLLGEGGDSVHRWEEREGAMADTLLGVLVRQEDLNGARRTMFEETAFLDFGDFSPAMMACVFAA